MTAASTLLSLAERAEQASGPDRELDAEIAASCRLGAEKWPWADGYASWEGRDDGRVYLERGGPSFKALAYTASLDAAMTLWPGEVPHLIPSDPRIATAMALRARAQEQEA